MDNVSFSKEMKKKQAKGSYGAGEDAPADMEEQKTATAELNCVQVPPLVPDPKPSTAYEQVPRPSPQPHLPPLLTLPPPTLHS